ncbi:MAG: hypothetical protein KAI24_05820 [Planctomycetes bacterium]|nr:hypothetical protein [Planctomycetota bacterium]
MQHTFPLQFGWKLTAWAVPVLGVFAIVTGLAPSLVMDEPISQAERWVAVIVGGVMVAIGFGLAINARCVIDKHQLHYFGFAPMEMTRRLAFDQVRRWGHAVGSNQGRREPMLAFELHDGSKRLVKLAMYERQGEIKALLSERLGPPTPAKATMTGVVFEE